MSESRDERQLVSYFRVYGPQRFTTARGDALGRRALEKKINDFDLPVIRTGKGDPLIDPVEGDNRLREYTRSNRESRRGPGRPRKP
jgi:hypothetical protein